MVIGQLNEDRINVGILAIPLKLPGIEEGLYLSPFLCSVGKSMLMQISNG